MLSSVAYIRPLLCNDVLNRGVEMQLSDHHGINRIPLQSTH
jgi:hypothetical protein